MRNSRKTHIGIYSAKIFLQIFFNVFIYDFEICPFLKLTENERKHVISRKYEWFQGLKIYLIKTPTKVF